MRQLAQLFGSKVVLAILGALLVGGVSAGLAAGTALRPHAPAPGVASTSSATNPTATTQPTATSTATPTDTPTTQAVPTATQSAEVTLQGTIHNLNASGNTFTLRVNGANDTITVDSNTTYQGNGVQSINDLSNGAAATVTAIQQADGTYLALVVNSSNQGGDN